MFDTLPRTNELLRARRAMSSEERLLLLLARGRLNESIRAQANSLLQQPLSWSILLEKAQIYCLVPLFYENLRQLGFPNVPPVATADLRAAYRLNAVRNRLMVRELAEVMRRLGDAGMPVMPLKGVALAASLYGNPSLRVCGDIDILVPLARVREAYCLLQTMGYSGTLSKLMDEPYSPRYLETSIECALIREERGLRFLVELHWGIFLGSAFEREALDALWSDARAVPIFGIMAMQVSAEWTLLCLAVHAARHQWMGLKWLCDIHELCTGTAMDWAKVRSQAERFGWEEAVELTLNACHALFDTPIPAYFSSRPLPASVRLFPADTSPSPGWQELRARARLYKSPMTQRRYLMRVLLVPSLVDFQFIHLPPALSLLHYPLRFLRLTVKYGWRFAASWMQRVKDELSRRS